MNIAFNGICPRAAIKRRQTRQTIVNLDGLQSPTGAATGVINLFCCLYNVRCDLLCRFANLVKVYCVAWPIYKPDCKWVYTLDVRFVSVHDRPLDKMRTLTSICNWNYTNLPCARVHPSHGSRWLIDTITKCTHPFPMSQINRVDGWSNLHGNFQVKFRVTVKNIR